MRTPLRYGLLACGWICVGLGIAGIALPILPTAPFMLLAAVCFARSSARLHNWLTSHPTYGRHIGEYLEGRGLPRRVKAVAVVTLWTSVGLSAALLVPVPALDVVLVCCAAGVSTYIVRLPTCAPAGTVPYRQAEGRRPT